MNWNAVRMAATNLAVASVFGLGFAPASPAQAASAGLVAVVANDYGGFLTGAPRDANAVADKLEAGGFDSVRLIGANGAAVAAGLDQIRKVAETAGPVRIVYVNGFGICLNDDLVLLTEDAQPEQLKSGEVGDVVVPMSVLAEAAAPGGAETLVVFDTNPNQCTESELKAIKLPENTSLLVTAGIGGDLIEVGEGEDSNSAFTVALMETLDSDTVLKDVVAEVVARIPELSEGSQNPMLIGALKQKE